MGKKIATGKQKRISHPRIKGKREKEMAEEEVESRGVCCKREGRERGERLNRRRDNKSEKNRERKREGERERERERRREDWGEKPEKKRGRGRETCRGRGEWKKPDRGRGREITCRKKPGKRGERDKGGGEKTWMKKTRERNKRGREPTCDNKNIAIMYANYSELNTNRHSGGYMLVTNQCYDFGFGSLGGD